MPFLTERHTGQSPRRALPAGFSPDLRALCVAVTYLGIADLVAAAHAALQINQEHHYVRLRRTQSHCKAKAFPDGPSVSCQLCYTTYH